jgi:hypothetical protein
MALDVRGLPPVGILCPSLTSGSLPLRDKLHQALIGVGLHSDRVCVKSLAPSDLTRPPACHRDNTEPRVILPCIFTVVYGGSFSTSGSFHEVRELGPHALLIGLQGTFVTLVVCQQPVFTHVKSLTSEAAGNLTYRVVFPAPYAREGGGGSRLPIQIDPQHR